jgi:hypothetical protein
MKGCHKPHNRHYFAVHLRPNNYTVRDCNHPDIDICNLNTLSSADYQESLIKVISSTDQTDYERNCKETGISKPSILSGLVNDLMFPLPRCFALDLMHLLFINCYVFLTYHCAHNGLSLGPSSLLRHTLPSRTNYDSYTSF